VHRQQRIHAITEGFVPLTKGGNLRRAYTRAPFETFANRGLKALKVAGVEARSFLRLNGREDLERVCPPGRIDAGTLQAKRFQSANRVF